MWSSSGFQFIYENILFMENMTKKENLPLPSSKRILPIHHSYWNCTKHGSDRKTQYAQSVSALIPNNNLGAKDFDRMLIILFSEIHRGSVIYSESTNTRFKSSTSLCTFRKNGHNNNISFRWALTKISKILRHTIKNSEFKEVPANDTRFLNLGIDT